MADKSPIEWTEATWNPVVGCSILSPGCTNCYAMKMAARIEAMSAGRDTHYAGTTKPSKAGPVWTGKLALAPQHILTEPLRWKRPRRIFVNSMSDLFHEDVPDEVIDQVFAVMALAPQHTFQVLTKRAARMRAYLAENDMAARVALPGARMMEDSDATFSFLRWQQWPLPNVWLGASTERQQEADERVPELLATPAAVRFISAEPLLGPIDFDCVPWPAGWKRPIDDVSDGIDPLRYRRPHPEARGEAEPRRIDWIIVGGESGPNARPMHPNWPRSIRDQCAAAGVPFFFKQWGAWKPTSSVDGYWHGPDKNKREFPAAEGISMLADGRICCRDFSVAEHARRMREGIASSSRAIEVDHAALSAFHASVDDDTRTEDNPLSYQWMYRVGKKRAGRLLDGREHNDMPEVRP